MELIAYLAWGQFHSHLRHDIEVKLMETHLALRGKKNFWNQLVDVHFAWTSASTSNI